MFQAKPLFSMVVLGALVPVLAAAEATAVNDQVNDQVVALKTEMVQAVHGDRVAAYDPAVLADAIARAASIDTIEVDSTLPEPEVSVRLDADVTFEVFPTGNGLAIEIYDAILLPDLQRMVLDGGHLIGGVTMALTEFEPQFVTRVEITLVAPVVYDAVRLSDGIRVTLSPATSSKAEELRGQDTVRAIAAAQAKLAEHRARTEGHLDQLRESLNASLSSATQQLQDAKLNFLRADLAMAQHEQHAVNDDATRMDLSIHQSRLSTLGNELIRMEARHRESRDLVDQRIARAAYDLETPVLSHLRKNLRQLTDSDIDATRSHFESLTAAARSFDAHRVGLDRLAARLPRSASGANDALDRLDENLDTLRAQTATDTPLDALGAALQKVRTQAPSYELTPPPRLAALMEDDDLEEQEDNTPPGAREARPVVERAERGFLTTEEIVPSKRDLDAAEAAGIIVLAQNQNQNQEPETTDAEVVSDAQIQEQRIEPERVTLATGRGNQPPAYLYNPNVPASQDPLRQPVNLEFQEMDLSTVVGLLARKAQINVIADQKVEGSVTANLQGIPLGRAIEVVLRMNNLGIIEEEGVYRITSYEEAIAARRDTRMIPLENAIASEVAKNIIEILANSPDSQLVSVSPNDSTNHLILSGPIELIRTYEELAKKLDIAPQVVPTVTKAIKLDYSEPQELLPIVQSLLSEGGRVSGDLRGRHLVVTDIPIKVEEIVALIEELDIPVKQVNISAMIVDALLSDDAQTGMDWTLNAIRRTNRNGELIGNVSQLAAGGDFSTGGISSGVANPINLGGQVLFGILSGDFDIRAAIGAEVASANAELLANPTIVSLENKLARISVAQEIPFQELTQSTTGPPIATTQFKEVGTILEVTTRVTHGNEIIADILVKQSDTKGESITGIPPEDKREAETSLRVRSGQTIFIGGLRRFDDELSVRKVPILGDIPVLNFFFRNQKVKKENVELLIFLTCTVMPEFIPELTPSQKTHFDKLGGTPKKVDGTRAMVHNYIHPEEMRDPFYKWRRSK